MSKVYEALQHAHAERHLIVCDEKPSVPGVQPLDVPVSFYRLPAVQMEREMSRLYQNVTSLLSEGVIQFIGSRKHEGTSTVVREFGLFLATRINKSVLLVDGDRSHIPQHLAFGMRPKMSLQRIMNEGGAVDDAIANINTSRIFLCRLYEETKSRPDLRVANHSELWNKLRKAFDYILIDSSPIGVSDDALALSSSADGVVLVIEAEQTRSRVGLNLKHRIVQSGGNILGLVFNKQRYYIPDWIYKRL